MTSNYATGWAPTGLHPQPQNINNSNGPRAKCDQVIYEAIAKACEIVVSSRGNSLSSRSSTGGSRFHIQVPEIQGVRSILDGYKLTLHVPIRLDVYYQHPDRRELLERWCLEYQPGQMERFLQTEGIVTQDPLAQLRHVCKRIVLWLRTLYCWTRLLPAQGLRSTQNIGFSIYVNSEGADDITDLTQNQGFLWQGQPAPVVSPYGELGWKVIYNPNLQALLAAQQKKVRMTTPALPIPQQPTHHRHQAANNARIFDEGRRLVPQSAPAQFSPLREQAHDVQRQPPQNTYDPSRLHQRLQQQQQTQPHALSMQPLNRRHTSIGNESAAEVPAKNGDPERVLSGLSLALMAMDPNSIKKKGDGRGPSTVQEEDCEVDHETKEKRHAALHEVPLHLVESNPKGSAVPATSEYGYAYNNQIPWQKMHTSQGDSTGAMAAALLATGNRLQTSPDVLASTPPSGAFLPGGASPSTLLAPRSAGGGIVAVAPPFQSRPLGFMVDAPTSLQEQAAPTTASSSTPKSQHKLASLDILHSSPFQSQHNIVDGSTLASNNNNNNISLLLNASSLADARGLLYPSSSAAASAVLSEPQPEQDVLEDMPFAVELEGSTTVVSALGGGTSSMLSTSVASFAQKCSTPAKLHMFEGKGSSAAAVDPMVDSLTSQLADFRSFGASLHTGCVNDPSNSANSTAISTRS